jgi:hypothetical protein
VVSDTFGVKCRYCGKPADGEVLAFAPTFSSSDQQPLQLVQAEDLS